MKRLLKEPLFHFLILGIALFAIFSLLSARDETPRGAIIVSAGKIEHLATLFARTWQRPPTRTELKGLIDDYLREEAAYREGMSIGLDRDDTIIRRRIRQKLEFIAEDIASQIEPSDDELAEYLAAHADQFHIDPRLSFRQVYLNTDHRRESVETDANNLLIAFKGDPSIDASTLGDHILLEYGYTDVSMREIANMFGQQFAAAVVDLEPGGWRGPIESGYGVHLVFVDNRSDARLPELDEVGDQVRREWDNARRVEMTEKFFSNLLDRYEIVIEWPEDSMEEVDS